VPQAIAHLFTVSSPPVLDSGFGIWGWALGACTLQGCAHLLFSVKDSGLGVGHWELARCKGALTSCS
jgi:hypothetical protein